MKNVLNEIMRKIGPDVELIRRRRKKLGLTQTDLARLAGVSQSTIAKIEKGIVKPSYEIMKKILGTLEREENKVEKTAEEIATKNVKFVYENDSCRKAAEIMKKYCISQLPVYNKNNYPVGSISEDAFLRENIHNLRVKDVMEEGFVQIPAETPLSQVREYLRYSDALLVFKKGRIVGIITKADLLFV